MPSPLGEGQTNMPINHDNLGEVNPTRRSITFIWERSIPPKTVFHLTSPPPTARYRSGTRLPRERSQDILKPNID
jgi:hypothetical protein